MQTSAAAKTLSIVGILLALIGALADPLRLGRHPGFGWWQGLVVVIGVAALLVGLYLRSRAKPSP